MRVFKFEYYNTKITVIFYEIIEKISIVLMTVVKKNVKK